MADRDQVIEEKAAQLLASKASGWDIGAAKAFISSVGRSAQDEAYKEARGIYASDNGWPVTTLRGARISLASVVDVGGKAAFLPAK